MIAAAGTLALVLALLAQGATAQTPDDAPPAPAYAGSSVCVGCHAAQGAQWQGSHHAQSMQVANAQTVLGDFNDVRFEHQGQTTRFYRRDDGYWVQTEGADGQSAPFRISHTFGVFPLQQYLIRFDDGRLQALGIAWDARPRTQGGQRWFALYPQRIAPGDPLHWTGRDQNWNFMCASCHSTGVQRRYDGARNRFDTRWAEIDVACESCHGPGDRHVVLARAGRAAKGAGSGLVTRFDATARQVWRRTSVEQSTAAPASDTAAAKREEEVCYPCHARRQELVATPTPGAAFLDQYLPLTLEAGLYQADGQLQDEVFEYGSFQQSKMHAAGVTCTACHEPHSLRLRAVGNVLCTQCHQADRYDQSSHHHHRPDAAGAACVSCHMPSRTYMGVHVRHDHSLRIPRPDLSLAAGTGNACNQCHHDHDAAWATAQLARWGASTTGTPHFAPGLAAVHLLRSLCE